MNSITKLTLSLLLLFSFSTLYAEPTPDDHPAAIESRATTSYDLYKNPNCGCCVKWQQHLADQGFVATVHQPGNLNEIKLKLGIDAQHQSCHTAVFENGFVFEGHVPVTYINKFIENPPANALGLAVPGMPMGSPGMEVSNQFQAYDILLLKKDGSTEVYASISDSAQQYVD